MAYTTPRTWVAGETVTDTLMNTHVRDNLAYLGTGIIRLNVNTTAVGNVGAGEDDLITYTLPAATLGVDGMGVRVLAWGYTANNANAKTLKLYFGSTLLVSASLTTSSAGRWAAEMIAIRTGATAQLGYPTMVTHDATSMTLGAGSPGTPAETLSGAVVIKATGTATANDDIVNSLLLVELIR